jgi:hypothetical protein
MTPFDLGQVTQELPDARITDLTYGPFVKATGLELHLLGLLSHLVEAQGTREPDRASLDESLDVLPSNQGNMLAEAASVRLNQGVTMLRFLSAQVVEVP